MINIPTQTHNTESSKLSGHRDGSGKFSRLALFSHYATYTPNHTPRISKTKFLKLSPIIEFSKSQFQDQVRNLNFRGLDFHIFQIFTVSISRPGQNFEFSRSQFFKVSIWRPSSRPLNLWLTRPRSVKLSSGKRHLITLEAYVRTRALSGSREE